MCSVLGLQLVTLFWEVEETLKGIRSLGRRCEGYIRSLGHRCEGYIRPLIYSQWFLSDGGEEGGG